MAVNLSCLSKCTPKRITRSILAQLPKEKAFEEIDLARIQEIERSQ